MKKYISLDKRSKKAQKEYYAEFRRTWDGVNPVTRTMPNGKAYNRKKDKEKLRKIDCLSENGYAVDFFVLIGDSGDLQNGFVWTFGIRFKNLSILI